MEWLKVFMNEHRTWFVVIITVLSIWELTWKGIALWKSSRAGHMVWFVAVCILNTIGILPIIYILTHKKESGLKS